MIVSLPCTATGQSGDAPASFTCSLHEGGCERNGRAAVTRKRSWLVPSGASFHSLELLIAMVMAAVGVRYAKDPPCTCASDQCSGRTAQRWRFAGGQLSLVGL